MSLNVKDCGFDLPEGVDKSMIKESIENYSGISYKDKTCLDLGANVGGFVYVATEGGAKLVKAFEPDARNFALLEKNTGMMDNVELFKGCISDNRDIQATVFKSKSKNSHCSSRIYNGNKRFPEFCKCDNYHLADVINSFDKLDVLKIDIEGYEEFLFRDFDCYEAILQADELFVEFHLKVKNKDFLLNIVEELKVHYEVSNIKEMIFYKEVRGLDCYFKRKK